MQYKNSKAALLMFLAAIGAYILKPTVLLAKQDPIVLQNIIPKKFAGWNEEESKHAIVLPPELEESVKRLYSQTISRTYINSKGQRIMLSIAYSENQSDNAGKQSHRPEVCYPAQGFIILDNKNEMIKLDKYSIPVRRMIATLDARKEFVTYWITVGRIPATTGPNMKLAQLKYSAKGLIADGLIFRISSLDVDEKAAHTLQSDFLNDLVVSLPDSSKRVFFGE